MFVYSSSTETPLPKNERNIWQNVGHSKSTRVEKINHSKRSKQVHSKDQLQVQEHVNGTVCITFEVDIKWIVYSSNWLKKNIKWTF